LDRFCLIHPCDRQTDRRTELRWLRRAESMAAFARKNQNNFGTKFCQHFLYNIDVVLKYAGHDFAIFRQLRCTFLIEEIKGAVSFDFVFEFSQNGCLQPQNFAFLDDNFRSAKNLEDWGWTQLLPFDYDITDTDSRSVRCSC